jgi:HemY protein
MEQWQDVQNVLPDLRKRHVLETKEAIALDTDAIIGQFEAAFAQQDWTRFEQIWQKAPARLQQTDKLVNLYVEGQLKQGEQLKALELIEQFMRKSWSDELAYQYGLIEGGDLLKRLSTGEKWLTEKKDNPWLLLSLGRLAEQAELWVKAEDYLKASLQFGPRGETYQLLAKVQRAQGRMEVAADTTAAGLEFMLKPAN